MPEFHSCIACGKEMGNVYVQEFSGFLCPTCIKSDAEYRAEEMREAQRSSGSQD